MFQSIKVVKLSINKEHAFTTCASGLDLEGAGGIVTHMFQSIKLVKLPINKDYAFTTFAPSPKDC